MNEKDKQELFAKAFALAYKEVYGDGLYTKTPAQQGTAAHFHGPGGIFGNTPIEQDVITAHVRPSGIATMLPKVPTVKTDPQYGLITGFTDAYGDEPDNDCDDAPAGYVKGCTLSLPLGSVRRDSQTIEMNDVMQRINRGDRMDLMLHGSLLANIDGMTPGGLSEQQFMNLVVLSEMIGVGVQAERVLSQRYWQGTVATGQMVGLDYQIATGIKDANDGTLCPALDSDVKDFGYYDVDSTTRDIVEYLSMMEYYLYNNAEKMGLLPVEWAVVMRPQLWFELSAVWPCSYLSYRCNMSNGTFVINDNVNAQLTQSMRDGKFIWINGRKHPVITDDGIYEHTHTTNPADLDAGEWASTIYMVPMVIRDGFRVTYIDYKNYNAWAGNLNFLKGMQQFWATDNGMFTWAMEQIKWCIKFALKTEQRIVLRTPHLAGKLQHVKYSPLQHLRSPYPDSDYFKDGGVSARDEETLQAVWR